MSFCAFSRLGLVQFLDQAVDVPVIVLVSRVEKETVEAPQLQFFDRGRCARAARWISGHFFLEPLSDSPSCGGYASVLEAFGLISQYLPSWSCRATLCYSIVEPHLIDAEFRKAWMPYFCRSGHPEVSAEQFLDFIGFFLPQENFLDLPRITGRDLQEFARAKKATAGGLDGWAWNEVKAHPALVFWSCYSFGAC